MEDLFYIDDYYLDEYQIDCVKTDKNLLVVAGAGCGKTSTILGKVKFLINNGYKEEDILCISLTNEATIGLENKLKNIGYNIDCYTFHKLGLNIIRNTYNEVNICNDNLLDYIVNEYFYSIVYYSYRKYLVCLEFRNFNYKEILISNEFKLYKENLITFINLLKNKDLDIHFIYELYKKNFLKYNYLFLLEIYYMYKTELESTNSFDFNDMISVAKNLIKTKNIKLKYKYIIIDEFQDTSMIRMELIKNIIDNNNAKLMCVGDDYQSIYRFAGSDIKIFLNFKNIFKDATIKYLRNTYRNSKELLYISGNFICKNKYQLKKDLFSNRTNLKPIKIYFYNDKIRGLKKILKLVGSNYMIIGRNNQDIYDYVENSEDVNNLKYFTAHKSKGLESDEVILINLEDKTLGFPNQIKNNKIISNILDKELFKFDEERRLFYVALTRTKNNVFLLIEKNKMSIFVREIIANYKQYIQYLTLLVIFIKQGILFSIS